jgi:rod shape-determining protein MreC
MHHIPAEPPAFFRRGPSPLTRLAFFGVLSIALLFLDTRYRYLENVRHVAAVVIYPLQRAAQWPGDALAWVGRYFSSQHALIDENAELKRRVVEQSALAQRVPGVERDNATLRSLLAVRDRYTGAAVAVEVLYYGRDPFAQKVFVSKGSADDIAPGRAVVDAQGVVGQVTRVFPGMSEVTLVTDKDHAVPVKVERSGVRSVMFGAGAGHPPELRFMAPNADIVVGDLLVTSGIDGIYPPGLPVAQVSTLERETGQIFAHITAKPLAGVDRSEWLLVLAASTAQPARPGEPTDPDAAKKSGKGRRRGN